MISSKGIEVCLEKKTINVTCISDLHGHFPDVGSGDLLIIAGDLTARHTEKEHFEFNEWAENQKYKKVIVIAGNHDTWIEENDGCLGTSDYDGQILEHLCDSGIEFEGLKIWGSPWTKRFNGMNPNCMAFTVDTDEELEKKWKLIPDDIDILITHCPPYGLLDKTSRKDIHVGSVSLREHVIKRLKPQYHIFGHIHEWGGKLVDCVITRFVNCSHMNEDYEPVNKQVRIKL